jgi:MFS family permease
MANWPIFDSTAEIGHNGAMSQRPPRADARRLALARLISMAGNMAAGIALAAVMWERTHSSAWVAAGALSTSLVAGIVTPITGALADRYDRRRVMIGSDLLAAVAFGILAVLVALNAPPATFLVAAAIGAVMESPFVPASRAALPNLVTDEDVPWANGLLGQVSGLSAAVGPLAGGALTGFLSGSVALGFNAVTFVASAWLVHSIRRSLSGDAAVAHASRRSMVREGFGVVRRTPLVRGVIVSGSARLLARPLPRGFSNRNANLRS